MKYYPVAIPTLCRFEHFKRCVESLAKNTHAENTELIIGLDYPTKEEHWEGYNKISSYIPNISGFKKITLFKREYNYGAEANSIDLANYAFSKYDAYIYTEDDNEFSPCFLDFMNKALEKYKDEKRVVSICGFLPTQYYNLSENLIFKKGTSAYGVGLWKHKEELYSFIPYSNWENIFQNRKRSLNIFLTCPGLYQMFEVMITNKYKWDDVMRSCYQIENNLFQISPYKSMVRNWGNDGTGLHSSNDNGILAKQEILSNFTFNLQDQEIKNSIPVLIHFFDLFPKSLINRIKNLILILIKFIAHFIKLC